MEVDILILAGAAVKNDLREYSPAKYEAFIKINGRPMVEYVIKAVMNAKMTEKIAIVGPQEDIVSNLDYKLDLIIDAGDSLIDNIKQGLDKLNSGKNILLISSDIPLITSDVIDEFICLCGEQNADIYYPVVSRKNSIARYPDMERTYVHLREGIFTGGNMVIINPEILPEIMGFFKKAIQCRKKPLKLSKLLGIKILFQLLIRNLSLIEIEKRVQELTGHEGRAIIMEHPEVGFDVDKLSDLKLMRDEFS